MGTSLSSRRTMLIVGHVILIKNAIKPTITIMRKIKRGNRLLFGNALIEANIQLVLTQGSLFPGSAAISMETICFHTPEDSPDSHSIQLEASITRLKILLHGTD